jgi:tetratricopeptide (TPR) repeat protein
MERSGMRESRIALRSVRATLAEADTTGDGCRQSGGESGEKECAMATRSGNAATAIMLLSFAFIWLVQTASAQTPPADDAAWTECIKSKDPDRVIASCTVVIARGDRRAAVAYSLRGGAYSDKGDQDQAIRDLDQAIALKPGFPAAYAARGSAYAQRGDLDAAMKNFDQAIEHQLDFAEAYYHRGIVWGKRSKYEEDPLVRVARRQQSIAEFGRAIELKPDFEEAYVNRGAGYAKIGKLDDALRDLDQAIRLKPDDAIAYATRAGISARMDNQARALTDLEQFIRLAPRSTHGYDGRARLRAMNAIHVLADDNPDASLRVTPGHYRPKAIETAKAEWSRVIDDLNAAERNGPDRDRRDALGAAKSCAQNPTAIACTSKVICAHHTWYCNAIEIEDR